MNRFFFLPFSRSQKENFHAFHPHTTHPLSLLCSRTFNHPPPWQHLITVFNDDEKTIAFRAHKNIFYLIVIKAQQTHTQRTEFGGIFRCRKLGNSFLCSMENPFRFDGSLNICCFVVIRFVSLKEAWKLWYEVISSSVEFLCFYLSSAKIRVFSSPSQVLSTEKRGLKLDTKSTNSLLPWALCIMLPNVLLIFLACTQTPLISVVRT